MCNIDPESFKAADSCQTIGGMSRKIHYALPEDIDAPFPAPPASPANATESATIVDDFTMVVGKTFHTIEADLQASSLDTESQGEVKNLAALSTGKFRISGVQKALVGWLNNFKNRDLIIVMEDNHGNQRLLGNPNLPAVISKFMEVSGTQVGDNVAYDVEFNAYGNIPYFFEGPAGVPLT